MCRNRKSHASNIKLNSHISTLARYLEAMGGHLELVGVFGDQRIPLTLGDLTHPDSDTEGADAADSESLLTPAPQL